MEHQSAFTPRPFGFSIQVLSEDVLGLAETSFETTARRVRRGPVGLVFDDEAPIRLFVRPRLTQAEERVYADFTMEAQSSDEALRGTTLAVASVPASFGYHFQAVFLPPRNHGRKREHPYPGHAEAAAVQIGIRRLVPWRSAAPAKDAFTGWSLGCVAVEEPGSPDGWASFEDVVDELIRDPGVREIETLLDAGRLTVGFRSRKASGGGHTARLSEESWQSVLKLRDHPDWENIAQQTLKVDLRYRLAPLALAGPPPKKTRGAPPSKKKWPETTGMPVVRYLDALVRDHVYDLLRRRDTGRSGVAPPPIPAEGTPLGERLADAVRGLEPERARALAEFLRTGSAARAAQNLGDVSAEFVGETLRHVSRLAGLG